MKMNPQVFDDCVELFRQYLNVLSQSPDISVVLIFSTTNHTVVNNLAFAQLHFIKILKNIYIYNFKI